MRGKHLLTSLLATGLAVAGIIVVRAGAAAAAEQAPAAPFSVMTRNLDLGSDLGPVLTATSAAEFAHGVSEVYDEVAASGIAERADGVAAEIAQTMPLVMSMQEVSLMQRLVPSASGLTVQTQFDQLASLQAALIRRGLSYSVAVDTHEFDVTVPTDTGAYVRLLDQDVLLTRADLPAKQLSTANPRSGHFGSVVMLPTPLGAIPGTRGWASIDVTHLGTTVRFIDTHLEDLSAAVSQAQAAELLSGPADTTLPVVIAADLNSGPGYAIGAYNTIATVMTDSWTATKPNDPGFTWSLHGEDGLPAQTMPSRRIDVVFTKGLRPVADILVGEGDLTQSGLYPSDHAGVVARLAPLA